ncbi:MAG: STAS domain-containing protein [Candidatus Riflebacteria bacterium]|nr:STAS domain-containing protein [Candidatus Riflebacteria bacterium]
MEILRTQGYLDDRGGEIFKTSCEEVLSAGSILFVFNFKGTPVINSTGLSMLLEMIVKIIDYKNGKVAFAGLSKITKAALQMAGVLTLVDEFETEELAASAISSEIS